MATINAEKRDGTGKGVARALRREGRIPAVLYGGGQPAINLTLDAKQFNTLVEKEGSDLRTQRQDMIIGKSTRAMVLLREYQVHSVNERVLHVDFLRFDPSKEIDVAVPVLLVGEESCPGVKRGGVVQHIRRELEVHCKAGDIPHEIEVDVSGLDIGDSVHIEDITLPPGVEVFTDVNFTIAALVGVQAESVSDDDAEAEDDAGADEEKD